MTNLEAFKALYVAFGGTASNVADMTDTASVVNAIASVVPAAIGAELPKVTSSDNGKVLTVVSGKWAKADLPS